MKKLGFLLLLLSVGMFSYGCADTKKKETTPPPAEESTDNGGATEGAPAPATDAAPAEGEKTE